MTTIEQSYVFPHAITSITTTSTKFGVSSKDIIGVSYIKVCCANSHKSANYSVANENGQIQSFPRLILNPRRTKEKPSTEEQEEWLVQYDPLLPDDTHRVLSHNYYVC
jgi:ER membrane protein complex subunit 1